MNNLKKLRLEHKLTQKTFAKIIGIANTTYSYWEKGTYEPDNQSIIKISNYYHVSTDYILGKTDNPLSPGDIPRPLSAQESRIVDLYQNAVEKAQQAAVFVLELGQIKKAMQKHDSEYSDELIECVYVPVVGRSAAGIPIEMIEHCEDDSLRIADPKIRPGDFAVIAAGDSMVDAGINDGDRVIIRPCPDVENGTIALVAVEDGSTIKRFYKTEKGYRLVPANDAYKPMEYGRDTGVRVLGRFIKVAGDC